MIEFRIFRDDDSIEIIFETAVGLGCSADYIEEAIAEELEPDDIESFRSTFPNKEPEDITKLIYDKLSEYCYFNWLDHYSLELYNIKKDISDDLIITTIRALEAI